MINTEPPNKPKTKCRTYLLKFVILYTDDFYNIILGINYTVTMFLIFPFILKQLCGYVGSTSRTFHLNPSHNRRY